MKYHAEASPRTKYRRIALATLLFFIAVSTVIHFTTGSLLAALKLTGPEQPVVDQQKVTILTISHLERETVTPVAIMPHIRLLHSVKQPLVVKPVPVTQTNHVVVAVSKAPVHGSSKAFSGGPQQQTGGQTHVELTASSGYQRNVWGATGSGGDASGQDPSYPGRQIPNGAVWSDNGPPGQSAAAGGVILGGGGGGAILIHTDHDRCSPSRGDFIGN